jgi:hypothetical protein
MARNDPNQPHYGAVNSSRAEHLRRLRNRARNAQDIAALRNVLLGLLDLLEDDGQ